MADYISREAAVKVLTSVALNVPESKRRAVAKCINQIELLPAADVEPIVRANWQFLSGSPGTFRCSNCGAEFEENPYAQYRGMWTGCPACRAKMQIIGEEPGEN